MSWKRGFRYFGCLVICAIFVLVFFSGYIISADAPGWMRMVGVEIQAACRDAGTQWMVVVCLVSYFVVFLFLEKRSKVQGSGREPNVESRETEKVGRGSPLPAALESATDGAQGLTRPTILNQLSTLNYPHFWLIAFIALVLIRYAFDYTAAAKSLQVVVLLTGIVVGKGVALWARSFGSGVLGLGSEGKQPTPINREMESNDSLDSHAIQPQTPDARPRTLLLILVVLLACASLYQPERGMEFQYRGQRRWTGVWDNPNTYGVLMGVGFTLAVGLLVQRLRSNAQSPKAVGEHPTSNAQRPTSNEVGRREIVGDEVTSRSPEALLTSCPTINYQQSTIHYAQCLLLLCATALCAYGLIKSYSRGAWLGTAVGIGYLLWRFMECGGMTPPWGTRHVASGKSCAKALQSKSWILPSSILIVSILVISFWQFRHTESPLLRRVFSVGNPNDFSWRNRVTAWQGAGRMMWDKPIMGFGWGKAEEIYSKEYRAARLEESAAVQLNDYLMIGISAGVPALACFVAYLWLALSLRSNSDKSRASAQSLKLGEVGRVSPCAPGVEGVETIGQNSDLRLQTSVIAAGGAAVLLIGFWFDGGLFKLPTCVVFWVLLELCRRRGDEAQSEGRARHSVRAVGGESVLASQLVSNLAPPEEGGTQRTARPTIALRWLAGLIALTALGMTTLHLGTPQLAVSERTLNIARKFIVPPKEKADFEYLAAKNIWSNTPLKTLLQHAHLANYNRTLVNWNLDDQLYREFVLSPEIGFPDSAPSTNHSQPSTDLNWRRLLWEYFYPRIRKESSLEAAAEIVVRNLNETCRRRGNETNSTPPVIAYKSVSEIWRQQTASDAEFERICVAALRSAGIPARMSATGQAAFWNGAEWKPAPRPMVTGK